MARHAGGGYVLPARRGAGQDRSAGSLRLGGSAPALITDSCGGVGSSLN